MRYEPQKANIIDIEGMDVSPGSIEALDAFSAPIPGQSLTTRPGSQKFEKPPEFTDPDQAVAFLLERIETDQALKESHLSQIASGVPIEYIVNTVAFVGFSEGMWTPDVAELIKPPLAMYFIITAISEDIPIVMFNPQSRDRGAIPPEEIAQNMSKLNPAGYNMIRDELQQEAPAGFMRPAEEMLLENTSEEMRIEGNLPEQQMIERLPEEGMI